MEPGFYQLEFQDSLVNWIAFNHDQRESVLTQLNPNELNNYFVGSDVEIFNDLNSTGVNDVLYARYQSTPLWKYAILLAILFLVAEVFLFKFMR